MKFKKIPNDKLLESSLKKKFKQGKSCSICHYKGHLTIDHIIKKQYYPNSLDQKNWQVLCERCHKKKTKLENYILTGQIKRVKIDDYVKFDGLIQLLDIYYHTEFGDFVIL